MDLTLRSSSCTLAPERSPRSAGVKVLANKYQDSFFDEPEKPKKVRAKRQHPSQDSPVHARNVKSPEVEPIPEPAFVDRSVTVDHAMVAAIRNLAPLLHPEEIERYADILDPYHNKPTLKKRRDEWRKRHGILD
jgi:hypothetical protein